MGRYDILLQQDQPPASKPEASTSRAQANTSVLPPGAEAIHEPPTRPEIPDPNTSKDSTRSPARSGTRPPGRRTLARVAFEFYLDQVEALRGLSLEEKMRGEKGSMSEMVREAVDQYLAKKS